MGCCCARPEPPPNQALVTYFTGNSASGQQYVSMNIGRTGRVAFTYANAEPGGSTSEKNDFAVATNWAADGSGFDLVGCCGPERVTVTWEGEHPVLLYRGVQCRTPEHQRMQVMGQMMAAINPQPFGMHQRVVPLPSNGVMMMPMQPGAPMMTPMQPGGAMMMQPQQGMYAQQGAMMQYPGGMMMMQQPGAMMGQPQVMMTPS